VVYRSAPACSHNRSPKIQFLHSDDGRKSSLPKSGWVQLLTDPP
jgi:hypothetical protein